MKQTHLLGKSHRGDQKAKETLGKLNEWSKKFGLGPLLDRIPSSTIVSGTFYDNDVGMDINLIDGGYGGNSSLPILLQGYHDRDDILLIEEPEISLHPGAQSEMWDLLTELAFERGHQIFFTSHSEYLLRKAARSIKEGKKSNKDITLLYATKDESGTKFRKLNENDAEMIHKSYWVDDSFTMVEEELRKRT